MKKIIAFYGSNRKKGNTTTLVNEIIRGFDKSNVEVITYNITDMLINPCKGCFACRKTKNCIIDDDMKDILSKINWEKSEKGNFNVENSTVEIKPRNDKGDLLSDESVLIKVSPDFTTKMKVLGWNDMINNINKPNTEVDSFIKQPNNAEYLKLIRNQPFYIDTNKAPNVPKGTILEYQIKNVKDPIPSAGRNDYSYDINLNIQGKPYSFSVNSTAEIHSIIDRYAQNSRTLALQQFTKENKQP